MPCSCIDTPTDKVCACKNRRTSSRENDDASSAQPLQCRSEQAGQPSKSVQHHETTRRRRNPGVRTLFVRVMPAFQSAKLRFYHEFFLRVQWPWLREQARDLIKRGMRSAAFPHALRASASECSRFGLQPAIGPSAQASCPWRFPLRSPHRGNQPCQPFPPCGRRRVQQR